MGYSYSAAAGNVMDAMHEACFQQTGVMNTYEANGKRYFLELSRREHDDGAITGTVMRMFERDGKTYAKPSGSVRIEGDGTVTRAPKFLKEAAKNAKPVQRLGVGSGKTNEEVYQAAVAAYNK